MSTELALNDLFAGLPVNPAATQEALQELIPPSTFLPYLQLLQPMSKDADKFRAGEFTYTSPGVGKTMSLGAEFQCLPIRWRNKAIYTATGQAIEVYYDPSHPRFVELKNIANATKSGMSDARYGLDILLWLPEVQDFGVFFLGSPTLRNSGPAFIKYMNPTTPILVKSHKIQKNKNTWFGVLIEPSAVPIEHLPDRNVLQSVVTGFVEAAGTEIKQIAPTSERDR